MYMIDVTVREGREVRPVFNTGPTPDALMVARSEPQIVATIHLSGALAEAPIEFANRLRRELDEACRRAAEGFPG